ncbi:MAG: hypothetical protein QOD84_1809 [Acidobacteriaceae bacterium]
MTNFLALTYDLAFTPYRFAGNRASQKQKLMEQSAFQTSPHAKRRFPRYRLDARMSVQVFRTGTTLSYWGRSIEIGKDGIGGTVTGELEPGEVVSLELVLPRAENPLKLRALVRYRQGLRHGFEFLTRTKEQQEVIDRLCETLAGLI